MNTNTEINLRKFLKQEKNKKTTNAINGRNQAMRQHLLETEIEYERTQIDKFEIKRNLSKIEDINNKYKSSKQIVKDMEDQILPGISVVVPTYGENENTLMTVQHILKSNYPEGKLQVVVVMDGVKGEVRQPQPNARMNKLLAEQEKGLVRRILEKIEKKKRNFFDKLDNIIIKKPISLIESLFQSMKLVDKEESGAEYKDITLQLLTDAYNLVKVDASKRSLKNLKHWDEVKFGEQACEFFQSTKNPNVIVIKKPNGGKHSALNTGIMFSKHDWVCCLDADTKIGVQTLRQCAMPIAMNADVCATYAPVLIAESGLKSKKLLSKFWEYMLVTGQRIYYWCAFYGARPGAEFFNSNLIISGAFGIFEKKTLERVGGFRHTIGEDMNLSMDIFKLSFMLGVKKEFLPSADPCYTSPSRCTGDVIKQFNRWNRGLFENWSYHYKTTHKNDFSCILARLYFFHAEGYLGVIFPFALVYIAANLALQTVTIPLVVTLAFYVSLSLVFTLVSGILGAMYQRRWAPLLVTVFNIPCTALIYLFTFNEKVKAFSKQSDMVWGELKPKKL